MAYSPTLAFKETSFVFVQTYIFLNTLEQLKVGSWDEMCAKTKREIARCEFCTPPGSLACRWAEIPRPVQATSGCWAQKSSLPSHRPIELAHPSPGPPSRSHTLSQSSICEIMTDLAWLSFPEGEPVKPDHDSTVPVVFSLFSLDA